MKNFGLVIVCFIIGMGLMVFFTPKKQISKKQMPSPTFSVANPPIDSLRGSISTRSGTLFWESRIATEPAQLIETVSIQQGERLITKEKSSSTLNFEKFGTIELDENADISFIQTLPIDFVVAQKNGTISYEVNGKTPLSVRLRSALITKSSGTILIKMAEGDSIVEISTTKGIAQIGYNDIENVSQVFTLKEGQVYEYNSDERTTVNSKNK